MENSINPSREDLAWVAGLFEGEGTVTFVGGGKRPYTRLMVCVSSTDKDTLEPFMRFWPVPNLYASQPKNSPRARMAYTWRTSCRKAADFLESIRPFVRTVRVQRKIDLGLMAQGERIQGFRSKPGEYRARFEGYKKQMAILNRRGT